MAAILIYRANGETIVVVMTTIVSFVVNLLPHAHHQLQDHQEYYEKHAAAKSYLTAWFKTTKKAEWGSVNDMRLDFPGAEMVVVGKAVFNIKANDYRLVALVGFKTKRVFVLWTGTHAEYDKIRIKDL